MTLKRIEASNRTAIKNFSVTFSYKLILISESHQISTDSFSLLISVSDWLIFSRGNLMIDQKKK